MGTIFQWFQLACRSHNCCMRLSNKGLRSKVIIKKVRELLLAFDIESQLLIFDNIGCQK